MAKELLEKIPPERRWEITARALLRFSVVRGSKSMPTWLGKEEGILSPVWGWEKWIEILMKVLTDAAKRFFPRIKELLSMPVEDAGDVSELVRVAAILQMGPEYISETVEKGKDRAVRRVYKCMWGEVLNEFNIDPELRGACHTCIVWAGEGTKAVNPKIAVTRTKATLWGDPYCEFVYKLKEE
jgi:hypothetical protein